MKVKETLEKINRGHFTSVWDVEEEVLDNTVEKVAGDLEKAPYRRFVVSTNVYKLEDGFIGIRGVTELKSEYMLWSDWHYLTVAFEYEEYTTISYRPKKQYSNTMKHKFTVIIEADDTEDRETVKDSLQNWLDLNTDKTKDLRGTQEWKSAKVK